MIEQASAYFSLGPYRETLAGIRASLEVSEGIVKVIGKHGAGKSALCEELSRELEAEGFEVLLMSRPPAANAELEQIIRRRFSLNENSSIHRALGDYLRNAGPGRALVVILDDAQDIRDELLQSLRLLVNLQDDSRGLVHLVLAGSPALDERLARPVHRSVLQHLGQSYALAPLSREQTEEFCHALMMRTGLERHGLEDKAVTLLHRLSRGYPGRLVALWNDLLAFREILPPTITARSVRSLLRESEDVPLALEPAILAISLGGVLLVAVLGFWIASYMAQAPRTPAVEIAEAAAAPAIVGETIVLAEPEAAAELEEIAGAEPVLAVEAALAERPPAVAEPETLPAEEAAANGADVLAAVVQDWLGSWQRQDVDSYFSHYHPEFSSLNHDSQQAWRADRRARLSAPAAIGLAFDRFEVVESEENAATVRFWLRYDSPRYMDETWKELRLRFDGGRWRILTERNLETRIL